MGGGDAAENLTFAATVGGGPPQSVRRPPRDDRDREMATSRRNATSTRACEERRFMDELVDTALVTLASVQFLLCYTYVSGTYEKAEWRYGCYARQDGVFAPRTDIGVVSGRCQSHKATYFEPEYEYLA